MFRDSPGPTSIGVNLREGKCHISVWAPLEPLVHLINESKGISIRLERDRYGYHRGITDQLNQHDRYRFKTGKDLLPDPASRSQPGGVHEASEVIDLHGFQWTDEQWRNPALEDYIIYEIHVGTFTPEGNFKGLIEKLPYLKSLGITAIELMPIAQFPGARNWGYDGVFPFAVQQSYGGAYGLQQLVNACHKQELAVILDVVYNHLGPEGNYLSSLGPYFTDKYKTPWGQAINFDDAYCDPVRQFFIENALMWLRDFHIDALRLDAVHAIKDLSPTHILREISDAVEHFNTSSTTAKYLIAETDLNDVRIIQEKNERGYGIDAQWCDEFHHALRVATGQERTGYYADFYGLNDLAKAYRDAYVYTGQYSEERHRFFGTKTDGLPREKFIIFSQNHDQIGNRPLGERTSQLLQQDQLKLLASIVLTSPYLPMIFMGEEWAASSPFLYFVDHSDPDLLQAIEEGRKREFGFKGNLPVAHDIKTFKDTVLNWQEQTARQHAEILSWYKFLIRLRKQHPLLKHAKGQKIEVDAGEDTGILSVHRKREDDYLMMWFNFSNAAQELIVPKFCQDAHLILDTTFSVPDNNNNGIALNNNNRLTIQPFNCIIISNQHVLP
jgi:maltooligosyltrehalose trehalohydrolase